MGALEEWIAEMFLVHSLNLLRFSSGAQEKILLLMAAVSKELTAKLNEGEISTYGKQRLGALLRESNAVISSHYTGMQAEMTRNLTGMVRIEADYTAKVLTQGLKIELGAKLPPATYLEKLVGDTLIKGAPSADWWKRQALDTQFRFASQVRLGAAQGETTSQIVSRVLGKSAKAADSPANKPALPVTPPMPDSRAPPAGPATKPGAPPADPAAKPPNAAPDPVAPGEQGILKTSAANARALVHSSVQAVANAARLASFQQNADLIECLVWLSTLDSHTCLLCAMRDLHEYSLDDQEPINHTHEWAGGPGAIHFSCRCVLSTRTKSFKDLGIELDEPGESTRPSDGGPVSSKLNFKDFLASKDKAWRAEYLGPGRAEMYEAGKITLNDLMNLKGRKLTLEQLQAKYK
ncbi:phage head morphogenesis protein [Janthinobacterium sp. UMAB-60]|uniref:phage head morphogenesis protein n=1 Tax=Janthinobacterium sp. UMAB-60 TaxID=1365365 RepID=UPI001C576490|nr:phage head morphogenesis protein [Janthinobacterium sp. UMAB-60]